MITLLSVLLAVLGLAEIVAGVGLVVFALLLLVARFSGRRDDDLRSLVMGGP